jgi:hypothetical protein
MKALGQVEYCPGYYRDLAPQEKPQKKPNGQNLSEKNGFLITEKTAFLMCA